MMQFARRNLTIRPKHPLLFAYDVPPKFQFRKIFFVIEHIAAKHGTPRYPIWQRGVPLKSKRESCALSRKELRHGNAQPIADPLDRVDR